MSGPLLCDTCSVLHWFSDNYGVWICSKRDGVGEGLRLRDDCEHPHEICPHWRALEDKQG